MDVVIPLVFPDYLITVGVPSITLEVPDLLPHFDILPGKVTIPKMKKSLPELGHAGVLFFRGNTGVTRYYEYGRYDRKQLGLVRRWPIPDLKLGPSGHPSCASLKAVLRRISILAGQRGRISGSYIDVKDKFASMSTYAEGRKKQNANPNRRPYDLTQNSCIHFAKAVVEAAGVQTPWMIDPRPNSYIFELQGDFRNLEYDPRVNRLSVEGMPGLCG